MSSPQSPPSHRGDNVGDPVASHDPPDRTKTLWYIVCDLGTKAVSSIALVVLGIAGWLLQDRAQQIHDDEVRHEQQERRYLPMLRTLIELEVALERSARILRQTPGGDRRMIEASHLAGVELEAAAYSLFIPGDPPVNVHTPRLQSAEVVAMPLRGAVLMYSQILVQREKIDEWPSEAEATLDYASREVKVKSAAAQYVLVLNPDAIGAWRAWMREDRIPVLHLKYANLAFLLEDLRFKSAAITHHTLALHPDLGDRYVSIRNDVVRNVERNFN